MGMGGGEGVREVPNSLLVDGVIMEKKVEIKKRPAAFSLTTSMKKVERNGRTSYNPSPFGPPSLPFARPPALPDSCAQPSLSSMHIFWAGLDPREGEGCWAGRGTY